MVEKLLRLRPSIAVKEKRLAARLASADARTRALWDAALVDAQVLGSLQLARLEPTWEQVTGSREDERLAPEAAALRRAQALLTPEAALGAAALQAWHAVLTGTSGGWRGGDRPRAGGPPTAPAEFIASRVELLLSWLGSDGARELAPARLGALALARLTEIAPFDDGNGRIARLAAAHLMRQAGARPPVLVGADRARLELALQSAFRLETVALSELLEEASERALDVLLQAAGQGGPLVAPPRDGP